MEKYCFSEQLHTVLEQLQQPFAVYQFINKRVVTLVLSDGFCDLFGYEDRAQAYYDMDHDMYKDTHPDDAGRIADAAFHFATEGGTYEVIYRTRKKDGSGYKIVHAQGKHVYTKDGTRLAHVWYTDEGTYVEDSRMEAPELTRAMNRALHEESMVRASSYDYLTGLPNMTYFFELAIGEKDSILAKNGQPMLMYIDFKGMKFFNAKHGFVEGDNMLKSFSRLLVRAFSNENCCRIGADHFAVIAEETGLEDKLEEIFREFGELYGGKTPPVHVGIYPHKVEAVSESAACDRAKLACSLLKDSYTSAYSYYNADLREKALEKQYIVENIDTAIKEKWIQIYLQPIVRAVNERVCDVEALSRWHDPEKGILYPGSFIPALEEAGLIYKLDLYMLDCVLETLKMQEAEGFYVLPHSINLSRADFDACDIVAEIQKRVDAAGVSHDLITIEVTESVVGSDVAFMKEQVDRFRELGFPVWMDDFGSGYSSLDVLQSIHFDLIKFDMSFMRKLDEGDSGKVILTELMRMATSLGVDTVCEGVEKESQVRFLQEIGCSKLQGYYYSKPVSFEKIRKMHREQMLIDHEDPVESGYYESIGRVNLFDLGVIGEEDNALRNAFSTIPIAILEARDGTVRYVRSNRSYQDFARRYFDADMLREMSGPAKFTLDFGSTFAKVIEQCCSNGNSVFYDDQMPDGSVIHGFARRISANPATGAVAIASAVLSISKPDNQTTYADIAGALAADYYNIFVVDLDTNDFIEYTSNVGSEELSVVRRGKDFFESAKADTMTRIYEEDREAFLALFTKENVLRGLDSQGAFTATYRLIDTGSPMYVNMKISRMQGGNRIILGVSIIDAQMKQREKTRKLLRERIMLGRIAALAGNYLVLYMLDPVTGQYVEYSSSKEYDQLGLAKRGDDFFARLVEDAPNVIYPEDLERHLRVLTKENMLAQISRHGLFIHNYRLLLNGQYVPLSLRATLIREEGREKIILGVTRLFTKELAANESEVIYTHLAHALARGYTDLYYVNKDTDEFIEFHTDDDLGVLTEARRGSDFFEGCERDAKLLVHEEDREKFVNAMNRELLTEVLQNEKVYKLTYRRIIDGKPHYVQMEITKMEDDPRLLVLAVSDIDELMKKRLEEERLIEERVIYARLHAITGNFVCVYVVEPETGRYHEFSAMDDYTERFHQEKEGEDFFSMLRNAAREYTHPDDTKRVLSLLTEDSVLAEIRRSGIFTLTYRIMIEGRPVYIQMKAAMVDEREGLRLVVGFIYIDAQIRQEEEFGRRLAQAQSEANIDVLTGVKNKHETVGSVKAHPS